VTEIPDKPFYKIGDVCQYTDTQPYVLRFWESEFPQLAPEKNRSGQRMYTRTDIDLVLRIKKLLYEEEFTIAGARKKLEQEASGEAVAAAPAEAASVPLLAEPDLPDQETLFRDVAPSSEPAPQEEAPPPPATPSLAERARSAVAETEIVALRHRIADLEARHATIAAALEGAEETRRRDHERRERVASRLETLLRALEAPREANETDAGGA
jgi:DNA-binding transcriptional MerR regulator